MAKEVGDGWVWEISCTAPGSTPWGTGGGPNLHGCWYWVSSLDGGGRYDVVSTGFPEETVVLLDLLAVVLGGWRPNWNLLESVRKFMNILLRDVLDSWVVSCLMRGRLVRLMVQLLWDGQDWWGWQANLHAHHQN